MSTISALDSSVYEDTNGMPLSNGKNLHMEVGRGEIANRIITVGSVSRAEKIAGFLDLIPAPSRVESGRGFTTISGFYNGVFVSVVAIGMGPSMMDFFVRETRAVVEGPIAMIRFGTCGGISIDAPPGSIVVSSLGSGYICRNPDAFSHLYHSSEVKAEGTQPPYTTFRPAPASAPLTQILLEELRSVIGDSKESEREDDRSSGSNAIIREGMNVTADSFYSSQGRIDGNFEDENKSVVGVISSVFPLAKTLEMETFTMFHLAKCCRTPIHAAAAVIVVANRLSAVVVDGKTLDGLETTGGKAMLNAISRMEL